MVPAQLVLNKIKELFEIPSFASKVDIRIDSLMLSLGIPPQDMIFILRELEADGKIILDMNTPGIALSNNQRKAQLGTVKLRE
jgi:succinyl-CoA synthetase alpha subunit